MMRSLLTCVLVAALALAACANDTIADGQTALVPIPAYGPPHGEAGGAASLRAAKAFLASVDAETRAALVSRSTANGPSPGHRTVARRQAVSPYRIRSGPGG